VICNHKTNKSVVATNLYYAEVFYTVHDIIVKELQGYPECSIFLIR